MHPTRRENETCLIYIYYTFAENITALVWRKTFMFQLKTSVLPAVFRGSTLSVAFIAQRDLWQHSVLCYPTINRSCWKLKQNWAWNMSDFFKNPSILFSKSEEDENTFSLVQFNAHNSFNSRISCAANRLTRRFATVDGRTEATSMGSRIRWKPIMCHYVDENTAEAAFRRCHRDFHSAGLPLVARSHSISRRAFLPRWLHVLVEHLICCLTSCYRHAPESFYAEMRLIRKVPDGKLVH